jgi:hypothetical protein
MYISSQNQLYSGDMAVGDREATQAEVDAWEAARNLTAARIAIDADRDTALAAGVEFGGVLYQSDAAFQAHITGIVGAINAGIIAENATIAVRTKAGAVQTLTTNQVKGLAGTLLVYVQGVFAQSWVAKDAL